MQNKTCRLFLALLCCFLIGEAAAKEIQGKCSLGRDYWLYVPDKIDPEKTYTLVVGIHGARGIGKGAAGYAGWVDKHDVIVLGPSYRNDGGAFQYLQGQTDKQTIELFKKLRKEYKLHDKLFIVGFSGGSQYAHRFAMKFPELVSGCAAHSGGTWATGDYPKGESPNPKARGVLFVISCGEKDTKKSFSVAPMGRLEWAKKYETMLNNGGFIYDAKWFPGVGHSQSSGAKQMSQDCFIASTQLLPAFEAERQLIGKTLKKREYDQAWQTIRDRLNDGSAQKGGIIAKVHKLYVDSLSREIDRVDRQAERLVQRVVRDNEDPQDRRKALQEMAKKYEGAPKTTKAIEAALKAIE